MLPKKNGLTLLELLVIIALIGILAAILLPPLTSHPYPPRRASCANNLKQLGLSMKMYANESKGERYPPMHVEMTHPDHVNADDPNPSKWDSFLYSFTPRLQAIYPEYMHDYKIFICPSDSGNRLADRDDLSCVVYDNSWDEGSTNPDVMEGCMDEIGGSYTYFAWAFDKIGLDDSRLPDPPELLEASWGLIGQEFDFSGPHGSSIWYPTQLAGTLTAVHHKAFPLLNSEDEGNWQEQFARFWDEDQILNATNIDASAWKTTTDFGNGYSNTIFRLREGIERFMLTDITTIDDPFNVQATIPVVLDNAYMYPAGFNHIPGGSNVLFMDGHVEFIKYNERSPVSAGAALIVVTIQEHEFREE
jgi:prepilin-type processing-associated H-X9-DG protein